MHWQSFARWKREDVVVLPENQENETTDDHETESAARGVANLLRRDGYGGEKRFFPIETGVRPI